MSSENQRTLLRRYLLGELPGAERAELGDRYFVDEDLFDQLLEVENELIDYYIYGKLSSEEALRFGDYLTSLPDGATKLATAYALKDAADERRRTKFSLSRSNGIVHWIDGRRPPMQYALAVLLVMLISAVALLMVQRHRRPNAGVAEQEQARQAQSGTEQHADAGNRNQQSNQDMDHVPLNQSSQENRRVNRSTETGIAVLFLTPSVRSGSTPDLVTVPAGITTLSVVIPRPPKERVAVYRVVLQTTDGKLIESRRNLRSRRSGDNQTVTLRFSVNRLKSESFKLTLLGKSADDLEFAEDFYFNVVRK